MSYQLSKLTPSPVQKKSSFVTVVSSSVGVAACVPQPGANVVSCPVSTQNSAKSLEHHVVHQVPLGHTCAWAFTYNHLWVCKGNVPSCKI